MWRLYIFSFFVIVASFSKAILYIIQNNFSKIGCQVVKTLCLSGLQPDLRLSEVDTRLTADPVISFHSMASTAAGFSFYTFYFLGKELHQEHIGNGATENGKQHLAFP